MRHLNKPGASHRWECTLPNISSDRNKPSSHRVFPSTGVTCERDVFDGRAHSAMDPWGAICGGAGFARHHAEAFAQSRPRCAPAASFAYPDPDPEQSAQHVRTELTLQPACRAWRRREIPFGQLCCKGVVPNSWACAILPRGFLRRRQSMRKHSRRWLQSEPATEHQKIASSSQAGAAPRSCDF